MPFNLRGMCLKEKKSVEKQSEKGRGGVVEKEEIQKSKRQGADSISCLFLSLFLFLSPPLTVSRLFWLQTHSQAVLFAL